MFVRGVLASALLLVVAMITIGSASTATGVTSTPAGQVRVQPIHPDGWCYGGHGDCGL